MKPADTMRTIKAVSAIGPTRLRVSWSDGGEVEVDLASWLTRPGFAPLADSARFSKVAVGDWGHSLEWPDGVEIGADALWLETLSASRREDTRAFVEWRLKHGLSLAGAAEALGLSRRMVAYYSNGEKTTPRTVLLACKGWEVGKPKPRRSGARSQQAPASAA